MDILKLSTDWAKAELFSAKMVWLFSLIVLLCALGFAYWGKTAMAKAFVIPLIVSGLLLISIGIGLYAANKPRISQFERDYKTDASGFVKHEISRTTKSENELKLVFKILPAIIIVAAIFLMLFPSPYWRAISITLLLSAVFLMAVDSNTAARNSFYRQQLLDSNAK
ncbi:hypothetical protein [Pedobacter cryoconitis]|uniref:Flp pilus assembly protein TadB n=1 Tax=Pedobacter cryoconitis TaxID=188932 RepID=A0A7X0J128_9SPHI|nr:hypothetical protein [Pedobacter cryoconitis]MBB6498863.1 Flp pilus assembly protein TadB [Pedobacter cryoconitis]